MPTLGPLRYAAVCWLSTEDDLRCGEIRCGEIAIGDVDLSTTWRIGSPFGDGDALVTCHAVRGNGNDGGRITLAIHETALARIVHVPRGRPADAEDGA